VCADRPTNQPTIRRSASRLASRRASHRRHRRPPTGARQRHRQRKGEATANWNEVVMSVLRERDVRGDSARPSAGEYNRRRRYYAALMLTHDPRRTQRHSDELIYGCQVGDACFSDCAQFTSKIDGRTNALTATRTRENGEGEGSRVTEVRSDCCRAGSDQSPGVAQKYNNRLKGSQSGKAKFLINRAWHERFTIFQENGFNGRLNGAWCGRYHVTEPGQIITSTAKWSRTDFHDD